MINPTNIVLARAEAAAIDRDDDSSIVEIQMLLNDEHTVSKGFFDSVRTQVEGSLPGMVAGQSYTAKQMCDKDFWKKLTKIQRISAGKCIAHMVIRGSLPLEYVGKDGANAKHYQLK